MSPGRCSPPRGGAAACSTELWALCQQAAGTAIAAEEAEARLGELQRSVLDIALAARELNWTPAMGLSEGLGRTWDWIRGA